MINSTWKFIALLELTARYIYRVGWVRGGDVHDTLIPSRDSNLLEIIYMLIVLLLLLLLPLLLMSQEVDIETSAWANISMCLPSQTDTP